MPDNIELEREKAKAKLKLRASTPTEVETEPTHLGAEFGVPEPIFDPLVSPTDRARQALSSDLPIGAIAVGTAGAALGGPAGAGLGAAAGEAGEQLLSRALGMEAPETSLEAAKAIATEGALGAIGEQVGRGVVSLAGKALKFGRESISPEAKQAIDFLADKTELPLTPAEATENRALDILENITDKSIFGSSKLTKFKEGRDKVIDDIVEDLVTSTGRAVKEDPELVGQLFNAAVKGQIDAKKAITRPMYNRVSELSGDVPISTSDIKSFANTELKPLLEGGGLEKSLTGQSILERVATLGDDLPFTSAQRLRSTLLSKVRSLESEASTSKAPAIRVAKSIAEKLRLSIKDGLKEHPDALGLWEEANSITKESAEKFQNKLVNKIIRLGDPKQGGSPESVVNAIFKAGQPTTVRAAKLALTGRSGKEGTKSVPWKRMQGWLMEDIIKKATKKGILKGDVLEENLFGRSGLGEKILDETFTKKQVQSLKELTNVLKLTQQRQGEGLGGMFVQLTQAGAVLGLLKADLDSEAAMILLGPAALARAFTNPRIANLLIQGAKFGPRSKAGAGAMTRFMAALTNGELDEPKESVDATRPK